MAPDNNNLKAVSPLQHVESLSSVTDRVKREKEQQQKQDKKHKQKQNIDDQLEEEVVRDEERDRHDGHFDFHA
jgi:hypothetical protein